jgi:hypothetical protein
MRKLLAFIAAVGGLAVGIPAHTSAGGWTVVSLDSAPVVRSGEDVEIGFTVLRHGITPESNDDLVVVVAGVDGGDIHRFPADQQGPVGHHVATINMPEDGSYRWSVEGPFVTADLGILDVAAPPGGSTTWTWNVLQWGSATLALVLAVAAVVDLRQHRHRRPAEPAPA